jgi:hypothetical protein
MLKFGLRLFDLKALDHSGAEELVVTLQQDAVSNWIVMHDDGVEIFKKIMQALDLPDQRDAVLQLSKGRFTTDPTRHSGEGIFFTSRMVSPFTILSDGVLFRHVLEPDDSAPQHDRAHHGTTIFMKIGRDVPSLSQRAPRDRTDSNPLRARCPADDRSRDAAQKG